MDLAEGHWAATKKILRDDGKGQNIVLYWHVAKRETMSLLWLATSTASATLLLTSRRVCTVRGVQHQCWSSRWGMNFWERMKEWKNETKPTETHSDWCHFYFSQRRSFLTKQNKRTGWLAYNLGLGCGYSVLEVVKCFESVSHRPIPVDLVCRRDGDVASSYSDCNLAGSQLEWKASRTLTDMCKSLYILLSFRPTKQNDNIFHLHFYIHVESISIDANPSSNSFRLLVVSLDVVVLHLTAADQTNHWRFSKRSV